MKKKYIIEDVGAQKYVIANFLDFKMTEDKEVTSQIHGFHMLINDLKNENIILPESFVVGYLIEKLPDSWKDYKKNNKHERKHKNLEDAIVQIRIEEKHRQMDQLEKAKEITSKANIVKNEAHPSKNQKPNKKFFKNKKTTFKKKKAIVMFVANLDILLINADTEREITSLLRPIWSMGKILLSLWWSLKKTWLLLRERKMGDRFWRYQTHL